MESAAREMAIDNVIEVPELRERKHVFRDRAAAGEVLARMLAKFADGPALILAVPAGGVPVALVMARRLDLPLDVAIVSKITLPWNTEAGYGAVAFDGTVRLNHAVLLHLGLSEADIAAGIERTRAKVERRKRLLRGDAPLPGLNDRPVILVDDGLASGFTMLTALEAVHAAGACEVVVAVPTGHLEAVRRVALAADAVYCANLRKGTRFAVADAYGEWSDVNEDEIVGLLAGVSRGGRG